MITNFQNFPVVYGLTRSSGAATSLVEDLITTPAKKRHVGQQNHSTAGLVTSQAPTSGTILSLYSLQNTQPLISQDYLLPLVVDGTMHHPYLHANFTWSIVAEL
jgi:hypothetical protein